MSVDTYLKRKNLSRYRPLELEGVKLLIAPSLANWAEAVQLDVKQFLVWKSFNVAAIPNEHQHGASCRH